MKNGYRNHEQDRRLEVLEKHCSVCNEEMGQMNKDITEIRTDVNWLKKTYWIIASASIGGLITALFNLLI